MFTDLYKLQGFHSTSVAIDLFCGAGTTQTSNQYKWVVWYSSMDWIEPSQAVRFTLMKVLVLWFDV